MKIKGWRKVGKDEDYILWETTRRSKIYKNHPAITVVIRKHPLYRQYWTFHYGQASFIMPKFDTKEEALKHAYDWMKRNR